MFFDKKFGLPQGLIDAVMKVHEGDVIKFSGKKKIHIDDKGEKTSVPVNKKTRIKELSAALCTPSSMKEHFEANAKAAFHYERGSKAATVLPALDEHGNQDGHMVKFYLNGKEKEDKRFYTLDHEEAHTVAKEHIAKDNGMNTLKKEEVTFSEAELAHINELVVPNTDKVAAGSLSNYLRKRSNSRLNNNNTPFSSVKPAAPAAKSGQLALSGPKKAVAEPKAKPAAKPAAKSATLTLSPKIAKASTSTADAAAAVAARQRANSSGNLKGKSIEDTDPRDVRDPMHSDEKYADWKAKQSSVGTKTLPTTASKPAVAATSTQTTYTLPAGKNTVFTEVPKAAKPAKETPDKKQTGTGKVAGKKTADLTQSVKPTTATKTTRNVHPKFEEGGGVSHYTSVLGTAHSSGNSADYGSSLRSLSANKKMKVGDVRDIVAKLTKHSESSKMTRAKAVEHLAKYYESKNGKLAEEYLIFFEQELLDTFSDKELEFITGYYQGNE